MKTDGSVDTYQNESPGKDKEANWLPAPDGPDLPGDASVLAEEGAFRRSCRPATAPGSRRQSCQ